MKKITFPHEQNREKQQAHRPQAPGAASRPRPDPDIPLSGARVWGESAPAGPSPSPSAARGEVPIMSRRGHQIIRRTAGRPITTADLPKAVQLREPACSPHLERALRVSRIAAARQRRTPPAAPPQRDPQGSEDTKK